MGGRLFFVRCSPIEGREISRMTHEGEVTSVTFSPDGRYVASGSEDGTGIVAVYRPEDLIANACARVTRNLTRDEWAQFIGDLLSYQAGVPACRCRRIWEMPSTNNNEWGRARRRTSLLACL